MLAIALIAGKVITGLSLLVAIGSVKTKKTTEGIIIDYREHPEVLDEILSAH